MREVNQLVLVNNSKRPLLLLAGEIVTGGKQDRVIGKDRIVPAESDPVDLSVFCVEPGRWVAANGKDEFSTAGHGARRPARLTGGTQQGDGGEGSAAGLGQCSQFTESNGGDRRGDCAQLPR